MVQNNLKITWHTVQNSYLLISFPSVNVVSMRQGKVHSHPPTNFGNNPKRVNCDAMESSLKMPRVCLEFIPSLGSFLQPGDSCKDM